MKTCLNISISTSEQVVTFQILHNFFLKIWAFRGRGDKTKILKTLPGQKKYPSILTHVSHSVSEIYIIHPKTRWSADSCENIVVKIRSLEKGYRSRNGFDRDIGRNAPMGMYCAKKTMFSNTINRPYSIFNFFL